MKQVPASAMKNAKEAIAAMQKGEPQTARPLFERAIAEGIRDPAIYLGLAYACANLNDSTATLKAVDQALELDPLNLRALIFKADHLAQLGKSRKALVFYQGALKVAAQGAEITEDIRKGLARAEQTCQRYAMEYESFLVDSLKQQGYVAGKAHPRFEQALDLAFGKAEVYYQQPTRFHYPELPQIQFYPRETFSWIDQLEAQTDAIRHELFSVMENMNNFSPYLISDPDSVQFNDNSNLDNNDWGAYFFYQKGNMVTTNAAQCPATMACLHELPLPRVPGSTPHALFSRLAANTKIPPHHGLINTRLICHLPLLVPENCGALRCGNQQRAWVEGEALVFDDTIEHEAWNNSNSDRVVLLFDIWRPELDSEERELVSALLQSVSAYESEDSA
jgi:aspartate beta-hydroxylase